MQYSKIRKLCAKSKLKIVDWAYTDVIEFETNPSDQRIIDEIEWKLHCAIDDYNNSIDDEFSKRDFTNTRRFITKLKGLL